MKFNFVTHVLEGKKDAPLSDLFINSGLDTRNLMITAPQYYEIFDNFRYKSKLSLSFLHAHLLDFLFTNMGGSENIKTVDVIAFCYVALRTNVFSFDIFVQQTIVAINFDAMCHFFQENDMTVPDTFMYSSADLLNDKNLFNIVTDRYTFPVVTGASVEDLQEFYQMLTQDIVPYMENASNITDMLKNMNINLSDGQKN